MKMNKSFVTTTVVTVMCSLALAASYLTAEQAGITNIRVTVVRDIRAEWKDNGWSCPICFLPSHTFCYTSEFHDKENCMKYRHATKEIKTTLDIERTTMAYDWKGRSWTNEYENILGVEKKYMIRVDYEWREVAKSEYDSFVPKQADGE